MVHFSIRVVHALLGLAAMRDPISLAAVRPCFLTGLIGPNNPTGSSPASCQTLADDLLIYLADRAAEN